MSDAGPTPSTDPSEDEERKKGKRRRRKKRKDEDGADSSDSSICDVCDLCDGCNLMRLSTVLLAVAATRPPSTAVLAGIGFYRRRLTRFTPHCPSEPSCSAFADDAVRRLGARGGLRAAAHRIRDCAGPIE